MKTEKYGINFSSVKPKFEVSNVYIQQYTRENLKSYEVDGMPAYYGQLNHKKISRDPEK